MQKHHFYIGVFCYPIDSGPVLIKKFNGKHYKTVEQMNAFTGLFKALLGSYKEGFPPDCDIAFDYCE